MTRGSIGEYTEAIRGRYLLASKKEKGRILDEFTKVMGYHHYITPHWRLNSWGLPCVD